MKVANDNSNTESVEESADALRERLVESLHGYHSCVASNDSRWHHYPVCVMVQMQELCVVNSSHSSVVV